MLRKTAWTSSPFRGSRDVCLYSRSRDAIQEEANLSQSLASRFSDIEAAERVGSGGFSISMAFLPLQQGSLERNHQDARMVRELEDGLGVGWSDVTNANEIIRLSLYSLSPAGLSSVNFISQVEKYVLLAFSSA